MRKASNPVGGDLDVGGIAGDELPEDRALLVVEGDDIEAVGRGEGGKYLLDGTLELVELRHGNAGGTVDDEEDVLRNVLHGVAPGARPDFHKECAPGARRVGIGGHLDGYIVVKRIGGLGRIVADFDIAEGSGTAWLRNAAGEFGEIAQGGRIVVKEPRQIGVREAELWAPCLELDLCEPWDRGRAGEDAVYGQARELDIVRDKLAVQQRRSCSCVCKSFRRKVLCIYCQYFGAWGGDFQRLLGEGDCGRG